MFVVRSRLKGLFRAQRSLFYLLLVYPFVGTFFILVSVGSILNISLARAENAGELYVQFTLEKKLDYDTAGKIVQACFLQGNGSIEAFSLFSVANIKEYTENSDLRGTVSAVMNATFNGNEIVPYNECYSGNPEEGNLFDRESFRTSEPLALVRNISGETVSLETGTLYVLGRFSANPDEAASFPWLAVNPAGMRLCSVSTIRLELERSLTKEEFSMICSCFDDAAASYEVIHSGESSACLSAVENTTAGIFVIFLACFGAILLLVFRYSMKSRRGHTAIFRILGCTGRYSVVLLLLEYGILFIPSAVFGGAAYLIFLKVYLGNVQTYLTSGYAAGIIGKTLLAEILLLFAGLVMLSVRWGHASIHRQWTEAKR